MITTLLAHHLEPQHVPVVLAIVAAGIWMGWTLVGKWMGRKS